MDKETKRMIGGLFGLMGIGFILGAITIVPDPANYHPFWSHPGLGPAMLLVSWLILRTIKP